MTSQVAGHLIRVVILESLEKFSEVGEKIPFALDTSGQAQAYLGISGACVRFLGNPLALAA